MPSSRESSPILSEDEEELIANASKKSNSIQGILSKWTNYIHGWQDRFTVLKDGTLSYYKSEHELSFGCRGSISILKATIKPHEFDECRFDVSVNDCVWYLRAQSVEDKTKWVEALEQFKIESGYGSDNSLQRAGSALSLSSNTLSGTSISSFQKGRGLKIKLAELETYRDILVNQIDKLQKYFDACSADYPGPHISSNFDPSSANTEENNLSSTLSSGLSSVDFREEALTFKATTAGVLTTISLCTELMSQRDEMWKKRIEKEIDKRKKMEESFKQTLKEAKESKVVLIGPDCEEGPHSALKDDEFYDAVEQGLDRMDEDEAFRDSLKVLPPLTHTPLLSPHPLNNEIEKVTLEQLHYARLGVGEGGWELFAQDGEMRMYKREEEVGGLVVDPLKAVHTVKGVTGREICHHFYSPHVRMEWETTLEQMNILETISEDSMIFLQIHKRVWPASQRDAVFWSHIRQVPDSQDVDGQKVWIVCNNSTQHPNAPEKSNGKYIRIYMTVSLVGQTIVQPPANGAEISRNDLSCRITYCSVVNPGGWAPASVLRAVYKREYPKFLKRFTQYVQDKCKNKPIMF